MLKRYINPEQHLLAFYSRDDIIHCVSKKLNLKISQKKVNPYSLKIHYTENGVSKDMYCRLGSDFKLFTSQQVKPDNQNIILENIELYTK